MMPDIHFACPKCKQPLDVPGAMVLRLMKCPHCSLMIKVPLRRPRKPPPKPQEPPKLQEQSEPPEPPKQPEPPKPPEQPEALPTPAPDASPKFELPCIQESGVAVALTFIGAMQLIASPFVGIILGHASKRISLASTELGLASAGLGLASAGLGWQAFFSLFVSGMIFLGFARVIQNTFETSQRLQRLEMLMERAYQEDQQAKRTGRSEGEA